MGFCASTKRRKVVVQSFSCDLSKQICVTPGHFIMDSSKGFSDSYNLGKRLGGGI